MYCGIGIKGVNDPFEIL